LRKSSVENSEYAIYIGQTLTGMNPAGSLGRGGDKTRHLPQEHHPQVLQLATFGITTHYFRRTDCTVA
jgi:hypothetical protein